MMILFCANPFEPKRPDPLYEAEFEAARAAGHSVALLDFEALLYDNDPIKAIRRIPDSLQERLAVYRGWMLRPAAYRLLFESLQRQGVALINSPAQYQHCHWLPESYSLIAGRTPQTTWLRLEQGELDFDAITSLLSPFGDRPLILKDFVKSRKHDWDQACFIPSASDRSARERIVRRFVQLQGEDLNEGLVFREYLDLEPIGSHSKSGMPMTCEYRLFWLDGQPILCAPHWEEGDYGNAPAPEIAEFQELAQSIQSRFFTMDVALTRSGHWQIIELGDGQVAGLPERADMTQFYEDLRNRLG